ncbi:MAG: Rnase Y domain-containing protein [Desulfobacterales bacterium]|nr:Rnase Y domain-containing protein [Desulfobacterales bacterium]
MQKREQKIEARTISRYATLIDEQKQQLERISGLTAEQAKELLIRAMENEARFEAAKLVKKIENEAKEEADKKVQEDHGDRHPALRGRLMWPSGPSRLCRCRTTR